jgi:hypothetical protein
MYNPFFEYRESHWEGDHTSYSWHPSVIHEEEKDIKIAAIIGETKQFYIVRFANLTVKKMKKEISIRFI